MKSDKLITIGIIVFGFVTFLISAMISIVNITFSYSALKGLRILFYISLGIFVFLILYRIILYNYVPKIRKYFRITMKLIKQNKQYLDTAFQTALIAFLVYLIVNEFFEIRFVNVKYFLIVVIVLGVLSILFPYEEKEKKKINNIWVYFIGIIGAVLIFLKTKDLGWLRFIAAFIAFVLIMLLNNIINEKEIIDEKIEI